jgi:hypothetical protein
MSTESKRTRRGLIEACPTLCGQAIESPKTAPGIADVWFTTCPVECKYLPRWPARFTTVVSLRHPLTVSQFRWLNKRYAAGFPAWVMLQASRLEWLLFAAPDSYVLNEQHYVTRTELYRHALRKWPQGINSSEVTDVLSWNIDRVQLARMERGLYSLPRVKL